MQVARKTATCERCFTECNIINCLLLKQYSRVTLKLVFLTHARDVWSFFAFKNVLGFPAEQTVYMVNEEEKAFNFSFDEDSCRADAHAAHLIIEPMSGSVPAKSR